MGKEIQKTKNATATSEESGTKAGGQEQKQGTSQAPSTQYHQRGRQTT